MRRRDDDGSGGFLMRERGQQTERRPKREEILCDDCHVESRRFELSPGVLSRRPDGPFEGWRGLSEGHKSWLKILESSLEGSWGSVRRKRYTWRKISRLTRHQIWRKILGLKTHLYLL